MPRRLIINDANNPKGAVWYDTHNMEKGQEIAFFKDCKTGDLHHTNVAYPGDLAGGQDVKIFSIGLHIIGVDRSSMEFLMDHFILTPVIGDTPYMDLPGTLCSLWNKPPGFLLPLRAITVYPKPQFFVNVQLSPDLKGFSTPSVRVFLFGSRHQVVG